MDTTVQELRVTPESTSTGLRATSAFGSRYPHYKKVTCYGVYATRFGTTVVCGLESGSCIIWSAEHRFPFKIKNRDKIPVSAVGMANTDNGVAPLPFVFGDTDGNLFFYRLIDANHSELEAKAEEVYPDGIAHIAIHNSTCPVYAIADKRRY
jgi:hypothetical protein